MRRRIVLWSGLLVGAATSAACGGGGDATPDAAGVDAAIPGACTPTAGSRLAPSGWALEGGERVATGWFDGERGEACAFTADADGKLRCLPTEGVVAAFGDYFLDEACAEAASLLPGATCDGEDVRYVASVTYEGCASRTALRPVETLVETAGGRNIFQRAPAGGCMPAGTVTTERLARLGPPVAPASFVAATRAPGQARGRLAPLVLTADDGAVDPCPREADGQLHDVTRDAICALARSIDGAERCLPLAAQLTDAYADQACTTPLAFEDPTCPAPTFARAATSDGCALSYEVRPITAAVPVYYALDASACTPVEVGTEAGYYAVGAPDDPGGFEKLTLTPAARDGRLAPLVWTTIDGAELATGRFADADLAGQACDVRLAADGVPRCLPGDVALGVIDVFTDPACAEAATVAVVEGTCLPDAKYVTSTVPGAMCGANVERVYRVTGELDTVYQPDGTGGCAPVDLGFEGLLLLALDEVPPETFVSATPTRW